MMNQETIVNAASLAAEKSRNVLTAQLEKQTRTWGASVSQMARDLESVGEKLRESKTIGGGAQLTDWAARYADRAGTYLANVDTERFIADIETFARRRPWTLVATAAVLGFAGARVVKSSSARRLHSATYVESYADDHSYESSSYRPTPIPADAAS